MTFMTASYKKLTNRFFSWRDNPLVGLGFHPYSRGFSLTSHTTHQSVGLLWMSDPLVAETSTGQHTQQTDIHAFGGVRTHDLSRRVAADPRLWPCDHWDRQL